MPDRVYAAVNDAVLARIPASARRVLDVGCGTGALGVALKRRQACHVTGVTYSQAEADEARAVLDDVVVADLDALTSTALATYDAVVCSHVLEHLRDPAGVLRELGGHLGPGGVVVIALPNVLHWRQRLAFLRGSFRYTKGGLMDDTHLVFFDWNTARELVERAGLTVDVAVADGTFPASRFLGPLGRVVDRASVATRPGLFGVQFLIVARRR